MTSAGTAGRPALPGNATYFDGEIPCRSTRRLPRFVDEFVMGQIEAEANLARLPDLTTQTAIVLLTETGLRSIDALRLPQGATGGFARPLPRFHYCDPRPGAAPMRDIPHPGPCGRQPWL